MAKLGAMRPSVSRCGDGRMGDLICKLAPEESDGRVSFASVAGGLTFTPRSPLQFCQAF